MKLSALLQNFPYQEMSCPIDHREIQSITDDSREVRPNCVFVAVRGTQQDGSRFIRDAVDHGATAVVTGQPEQTVRELCQSKNVCLIQIAEPKPALKELLRRFYGNPSEKVKTIGITGTNGKTTITYLLEAILRQSGNPCGVIGTINHRIAGKVLPSVNTTPGLVDNQIYLSEMVNSGVRYCAMEVSSHALDQGRVDLIDFSSAVFTNLTGDHLDYHQDMDNYFKAKSLLFTRLSPQSTAVINTDDPYGHRLTRVAQGRLLTYGIDFPCDVQARDLNLQLDGTNFTIQYAGGELKIRTRLIGKHNVYNILAATAVCLAEGIEPTFVQSALEQFAVVPGRLEQVLCGQPFPVFVDYAHTEDALKNVLTSLRQLTKGKIFLVFGCGGNRDQTKRPKMGKVAREFADFSIITCDNPREEDPQLIVDQIVEGFKEKSDNDGRHTVILDRAEAIAKALSLAHQGDVVLIAGKGHENYQIFRDRKVHFDDREVVKNYLASKSSSLVGHPGRDSY